MTDPFADVLAKGPYRTILIDPPWRFKNRTGKIAPEHKRLHRYRTLSVGFGEQLLRDAQFGGMMQKCRDGKVSNSSKYTLFLDSLLFRPPHGLQCRT